VCPSGGSRARPPNPPPGLDQRLIDVRERTTAGEDADLLVRVTGELEREVDALPSGECCQGSQSLERLERVVERVRVGDEVFAVAAVGATTGESRVATLDRREAVGLVDGDYLSSLRHTAGHAVSAGDSEGWRRRSL
jgi:hypothetical protein